MPRFLIIRFSSIGDIVLTTPVIRCLKQQVPDAEIHFLVREKFRQVLEHNPYISRLIIWAHSRELMMEELKAENYDFIIDLQHNKKSNRIRKQLKKKSAAVNKLNIRKLIYTFFKINTLPGLHITDRYLQTVQSLGVCNDGKGLDYFIGEKDCTKKNDIPFSHQAGYIACVIGAAHATKRWPLQKWVAFCREIRHPVVLLGGAEDRERGDEISAADPVKVYNACGRFSINESADLVRKAKLVVTHDTGLMHIAAAFKKPVISIWGNTVPAFGMTPYYGDAMVPSEIMEVHGLWCRPCSKIGYKKCPLGHFRCMQKTEVSELLKKVNAALCIS